MTHPLRQDYSLAIQHLDHFVQDPRFKIGKPILHERTRKPMSYSGSYSSVYPVDINGKTFALRCWVADITRVEERYQEANSFFTKEPLPYFVDFEFVADGILVNGRKYPILIMEWAEGLTLNKFLDLHYQNSELLFALADAFAAMVDDLHKRKIAHGDLQDGNLLVEKNGLGPTIKLIDYDSLYIPALSKWPNEIYGLPAYQHPARFTQKVINKKMDYFSELVIYSSLIAYAELPNMWRLGQEQKLVFQEDDYKHPSHSRIFRELRSTSPELDFLIGKLDQYCKSDNIGRLQPLEAVLAEMPATHVRRAGNPLTWAQFPSTPNSSPEPNYHEIEDEIRFDMFDRPPLSTESPKQQPYSEKKIVIKNTELDAFFNKGSVKPKPKAQIEKKPPMQVTRPAISPSKSSSQKSLEMNSLFYGIAYGLISIVVGLVFAMLASMLFPTTIFLPAFTRSVMIFLLLATGPIGLYIIQKNVVLGSTKHFTMGSIAIWGVILLLLLILFGGIILN